MLQFESPDVGFLAQAAKGAYWVSPQRDLVHSFPMLVRMALVYYDACPKDPVVSWYKSLCGSPEQADQGVNDVAMCIAKFIKSADDQNLSSVKIKVLATKAGWYEIEPPVKALFGYLLSNVLMSSYVQGSREARACRSVPYAFGSPDDILTLAICNPCKENCRRANPEELLTGVQEPSGEVPTS